MGGTYRSASLLARKPPATDTFLLPRHRSQDVERNTSILREEQVQERERERECGKEKARGRDGVMHLEAEQVRGRATELVERDAVMAEEGDQAASINAEGDGRSRRERERERERERRDGVMRLKAEQVRGRAIELAGRGVIAAVEGDRAAHVDAKSDGEDQRGSRVGQRRSRVL
ncbi:hypothetical protein MUK42_11327 [Musa troglodytarum]|uniref:Uncharacterized protein n=1 Tax=Musa troglodytarum TaxID=320322 RepID=A0A9E7F3A4_9LILI|nr:hypothetical protein MUK42_11327 [Musa troglodytarum]URD88207.1 hypothetical protein MUK42_11327 [Musa troglodytarum]URD88208.1 hypothetical protein MUK42_11327 [Musa troglodytarum]